MRARAPARRARGARCDDRGRRSASIPRKLRAPFIPRWEPRSARRRRDGSASASYQWGGVTPWGADCSGMVQTVFGMHGVPLPRDARQQAELGTALALDTSCVEPWRSAVLLRSRGRSHHARCDRRAGSHADARGDRARRLRDRAARRENGSVHDRLAGAIEGGAAAAVERRRQLTSRLGGSVAPIGVMSLRTTSRTSPCASPSSAMRIAYAPDASSGKVDRRDERHVHLGHARRRRADVELSIRGPELVPLRVQPVERHGVRTDVFLAALEPHHEMRARMDGGQGAALHGVEDAQDVELSFLRNVRGVGEESE